MSLTTTWFQTKLFSSDQVERHYSYLISLVIVTTALYIVIKPIGTITLLTWGAPICTLWAVLLIALSLYNIYAERSESTRFSYYLTQGLQFLTLMLVVPVYYDGTNVVNRYRYSLDGDALLYDEWLLRMDHSLLGWLFPHGQLALYLDTSTTIGVQTMFGRLTAEFLQLMYVSYYFWGNALGVFLAYDYFYTSCYKQPDKKAKQKQAWRKLQLFTTCWVAGFLFNFLLNLLFPAVSPRIYLKSYYINDVEGIWLTSKLRGALTSAASGTFSAFPSGHCGQSWLTAILAYRAGWYKYAYLNVFNAIVISLATMWLRYHYFVDFLFCGVTIAFGCYLGSHHSQSVYNTALLKQYSIITTLADEAEEVSLMEKGLTSISSSPASSPLSQRSAAVQPLTQSASEVNLSTLQSSPSLVNLSRASSEFKQQAQD